MACGAGTAISLDLNGPTMPPPRLAIYLDDGLVCGGTERVALKLLNHWTQNGWEVFLVARTSPHNGFYDLPPGVQGLSLTGQNGSVPSSVSASVRSPLLRFIPARSFLRLICEAIQLRKVLHRIDADVSVAFLTPANVKLLLSTVGLRCKTVISERSDTRRYPYPRTWLWLRHLLYRWADVVTANMIASVQDMERYVPKSNLVFVPNPVELPPDDATADPAHSLRIVSVGRLVPGKRHLMLIQAFASLGPGFSEWELDIVGEGPMLPELKKEIAKHGLAHKVHLHGLSRDVDSYYRAGGIFVLPSNVEGTPNALLEAMAHGLPCITSDSISGAHDYIEEGSTGAMFASDSLTELTYKIESLASSPDLRDAMGRQARRRMLAAEPDAAYQAWDQAIGLVPTSHITPASNP